MTKQIQGAIHNNNNYNYNNNNNNNNNRINNSNNRINKEQYTTLEKRFQNYYSNHSVHRIG